MGQRRWSKGLRDSNEVSDGMSARLLARAKELQGDFR